MASNLNIIQETAYVPDSRELQIIQEGFDESGLRKMVVQAVLQTSGVKNINGRVYTPEILQSIVTQLLPKVQNRSLLCELDHPQPETSDTAVLKKRAVTVALKNAAAMITSLQFDGEKIVATLEILNTDAGKIVQTLIKDGVRIGFSLRALGVVQDAQTPDGSSAGMVESVRAITYDIVSNPSHNTAIVQAVLTESTNLADILSEMETISENVTQVDDFSNVIEEGQYCDNEVCKRGTFAELAEYIIETALSQEKLRKVRLFV